MTATVNKSELATALKVSLPTLDRLIEREPAFPIATHGDRGRAFAFDLADVTAFLQQRADEAAAAGRARDELLAQFTLPGLPPVDDGTLTPTERLTLARAREIERREARESGFLIETARLRATLTDAWSRLGRAIDTAIRQTLRDANIPDPVIRQVEARIAEAKRRTVEELAAYLTEEAAPPHGSPQPTLM